MLMPMSPSQTLRFNCSWDATGASVFLRTPQVILPRLETTALPCWMIFSSFLNGLLDVVCIVHQLLKTWKLILVNIVLSPTRAPS